MKIANYRLQGEELWLYELRGYIPRYTNDPEGFIGCVFGSRERIWVNGVC